VDHNEIAQSLADFENSEVLAIIDHHKLGIKTNKPIYLLSEPVGATATIIYFKYKELGISIPEKIAGLMLSAIISDTLLLNPDYSCTKFLTTAKSVEYNKLP